MKNKPISRYEKPYRVRTTLSLERTVSLENRFFLFATVTPLLFLIFSCANEATDPPVASKKISLEVVKTESNDEQRVFADDIGSQAVVITWDSQQPTVRSDALRATIWNVSERPIKANLKVVAYGPTGDTITRKLGSRALNGGSSQLVHVPIGDLPIQSAGASTAVILVASYPGDSLYSTKGNAQESGTVEAFSVYKHVTFDEDFSIATIRTIEAQVEANQPIYEGESKPGPIAMRVYDESTDTINKAASAVSPNFENKGEPAAVVSILKLDPSAYGPRSITDLRFQTKEE